MTSVEVISLIFLGHISSGFGFVKYYGPYTSCNYQNTTWSKGSGQPIRSYLRSVVPLLKDTPQIIKSTPSGLTATFSIGYTKEYLKEIKSSKLNLTWRVHGKGKYDGWLYGRTIDNEFTGDNIAYVYDDLKTSLIGKFEKGVMRRAKRVNIKAYRCNDGFLEVQFTKPKSNSPIYKFEQPNSTFITSNWTLMDSHDKITVYVANSTLPTLTFGDGLFAKRDIPATSLIAIYAGYFVDANETFFYDNMTIEERESLHKNLMSYNDTHNLDLPPELTSIVTYRASLGHKVNNGFGDKQNSEFCFIEHPRFGHCRCIRSIRAIAKGEEIFIDYGYDVKEESTPRWFKDLHKQLFGDSPERPNLYEKFGEYYGAESRD